MNGNRRQFLDDQFDAFTMLAEGNYVSLYDVKEKVTRYSQGAVELFGLKSEYIEEGTENWMSLIHPEDRKRYQSVMDKLVSGETLTYDINYRVKISDGNYGLFRFKGAVIRDDDGSVSLVGGVILNEGLMEHTDAITALRNRMGFFNDLAAMQAMNQESLLMLVGINRMTEINTEYGYGYGNRLLQSIGWIVQECAGHDGIVYRMEGSKFAIMSHSLESSEMEDIYNRIRLRLQSGVELDGVKQNLTCGGGLMMVDNYEMDERAIYTCLNYAYKESKNRRHGGIVSFSGNLNDTSKQRLELINEIRNSMVNDCENFHVKYQPIFNIEDEGIVGAEALVRFENEKFGEVLPGEFIPILENDFAFEEMGIWVMHQAMRDGKRLLERNSDFILGLNIAASQFEDVLFIDMLRGASDFTGFPLTNICLELSRDCRMLDWELLKDKLSALKDMGVKLLLDDFGSGYASLEAVKDLPVDFVKFDMEFVNKLENDDTARADLEHLAEIASIHEVAACVKGIETDGIFNIIKNFEIVSGQGFSLGRPVDIDEVLDKYVKK